MSAPDDGENWVIAILREHGREAREFRPYDADEVMARYRAALARMEADPEYRARIDRIIAEVDAETATDGKRRCPDDGACHHGCTTGCFRVLYASPLTAAGWGDQWPDEVKAANAETDGLL